MRYPNKRCTFRLRSMFPSHALGFSPNSGMKKAWLKSYLSHRTTAVGEQQEGRNPSSRIILKDTKRVR